MSAKYQALLRSNSSSKLADAFNEDLEQGCAKHLLQFINHGSISLQINTIKLLSSYIKYEKVRVKLIEKFQMETESEIKNLIKNIFQENFIAEELMAPSKPKLKPPSLGTTTSSNLKDLVHL